MPKPAAELIQAARMEARTCTVEEAARRIAVEPALTVLDVRAPPEHQAGMLPGAVPLPRGLLEMRVQQLAPSDDQPILVYCGGGARAALASRTLAELGYRDVTVVDDSFEALEKACSGA